MLSGIKAWLRHPKMMFARLRYAQISTKITCFYAAVLLLVLILTVLVVRRRRRAAKRAEKRRRAEREEKPRGGEHLKE